MKVNCKYIVFVVALLGSTFLYAQQYPQYTQYMYNTMSINPGYTGSRGHMSIVGLYRTQWVGLDGAPETQTLGIDTPVGKNVGLGLNVVHDALGPTNETYLDGNFSYTVRLDGKDELLSFGLKAGGRFFDADFSKGIFKDPDVAFQGDINKFYPTIGAGVYYHNSKGYLGVSVPNFFAEDHYDDVEEEIGVERVHFYFIGGKVFDLSYNVKFKPAFIVKYVPAAPVITDLSANFMFYDRFTLGAAYRWGDSFSGLIGLQITDGIGLGYAYDATTTNLRNYSSGTHEIYVRFEFKSNKEKLKSPRFF
ncbi:PorP/SprF family type IX secretion system membrane protein [Galbibacter mesophilus]|uniref:PorP/SprF family type IX secretion system membrane protein n=1 Tax=Galbibacter mesophilus TaxID=379069 RepID=UPI00191FDFF3|nr:type IX secretion system membrane protein PorP/SprF [Galbibacter mesophilus]MCM5663566.1 type IX secretion system membrane protein PorP/SprF [Galbibacter mesophilus]